MEAHLCGSEDFQRAVCQYEQIAHRLNDALPREGVSLLEEYVNGRLSIAVRLKSHCPPTKHQAYLVARADKLAGACNPPAVLKDNLTARQVDNRVRGYENLMLVGDVELMEAVKPLAVPTRERLYSIQNNVADALTRAVPSLYVTVDGTFDRLPIPPEGEVDVAVDFVSVGLDEQTVSVIEGGPEIVDRIAEHCRSMAGQFATERHLPSRTVVFVGLSHSLSVFAYVIGEQPFELSDVMFGPLDLQLWPREV